MKEIVEMEDEEEANRLLSACSRLVLFIAKNKFDNFGYKAMMELLLLDKEKKDLINQVIFYSISFKEIMSKLEIRRKFRDYQKKSK